MSTLSKKKGSNIQKEPRAETERACRNDEEVS